jgi:hypothetical protein
MNLSSEDELSLRELKKISKILTLANAPILEKELSKIANSDTRKKMWVLIDGKRMPKDITKEVGVSLMAVSRFLDGASVAGLVEYTQREPPRKTLDYTPPSWINLVMGESSEEAPKEIGDAKGKAGENELKSQTTQTELSAILKKGEGKDEQGRE